MLVVHNSYYFKVYKHKIRHTHLQLQYSVRTMNIKVLHNQNMCVAYLGHV